MPLDAIQRDQGNAEVDDIRAVETLVSSHSNEDLSSRLGTRHLGDTATTLEPSLDDIGHRIDNESFQDVWSRKRPTRNVARRIVDDEEFLDKSSHNSDDASEEQFFESLSSSSRARVRASPLDTMALSHAAPAETEGPKQLRKKGECY